MRKEGFRCALSIHDFGRHAASITSIFPCKTNIVRGACQVHFFLACLARSRFVG